MNAAKRMSIILSKIRGVNGKNAYDTFEDVFSVKGCIPLANKLGICDKQINILSEKSDKKLVAYLHKLFNCKGLTRDISSEKREIDHYIMALNTAGAYMDEEKINDADITELSEMLEILRAKVEKSDIPEQYREIIDAFIDEMRDAIADINIGGIKAFMSHAEVANGKILMYNEAFVKGGVMDDVTKIFDATTKIINDSNTWIGLGIGIAGVLSGI